MNIEAHQSGQRGTKIVGSARRTVVPFLARDEMVEKVLHLAAPGKWTDVSVGEYARAISDVEHEVLRAVAHVSVFCGLVSVFEKLNDKSF